MSITLNEADAQMLQSVKVSNQTFDPDERHRAIQTAAEQFLSQVPAATDATTITLASGASTVDVPASITGFTQNDWLDRAHISYARVRLAPWGMVQRRWAAGTPTAGQPTLIAFRDDDQALLDRPTDAEYTLTAVHRARLTVFTPGTTSNPTLNLPVAYAARIMRTGAAAELLHGAHIVSGGQMNPAAASLVEQFQQVIEEAKAQFPSTRNGIQDRNVASGA